MQALIFRHRRLQEILMPLTIDEAKRSARVLREDLQRRSHDISHGQALEIVAHQLGYADWNTAASRLDSQQHLDSQHRLDSQRPPDWGSPVPVIRIQDHATAYDFYVEYLGFAVQWEHRFEPELPLYARLARSGVVIDLSEHYGDGTPGSAVWIPVRDVEALHVELIGKRNAHSRPGVDRSAPGVRP
ncbi:glyoxalase [Frondihabitans sucicola]|uniref:Glyoxalase n=2 Tax=Frondihabitans sucicola TaxID=1268041 RepID=A0ABN6XYH5_9MICO|nr:glyoxalase [Frondihabitans sucicola]